LIQVTGASDERIQALAAMLELKEPCDGAGAFAATELGRLGPKARSAAPHLLAALKHSDAQVRLNAASALGHVGAHTEETVNALIGLLKDDPEREIRRSAAGALGRIGPAAKSAIPALREALKGDGGGWWVAADALGKVGGADVVHALTEALTSTDAEIRLTAIRRLGDLGTVAKPAVEALQKARRDDPRENNRNAAAEALRKINSD